MNAIRQVLQLHHYWQGHPLATRNLWATWGRFIRWQLGSRLLRAPIIWPWIGQTRLAIETGMTGATMNIYCGLHEFVDMAFLLHLLRPEDRFVDVGANIGSYTVLAARHVGAHVISVEPVPATYAKLRLNIGINNIDKRVKAVQCGIGANDGETLDFVADCDTTNRVAPVGYSGTTVRVPIRTMDSLVKGFPAVLWKVDVEGFEEAVLSSAAEALAEPGLLAVELEGDSPQICQVMQSAGFVKCAYDPFSRKLEESTANRTGHNWLWVRDVARVAELCRSAPKMTINGVEF